MQDNAYIHTLRAMRAFIAKYYITIINLLPYLLNLNLIKHL
jgi:hypothetical protein